jgi:hypothetical protein
MSLGENMDQMEKITENLAQNKEEYKKTLQLSVVNLSLQKEKLRKEMEEINKNLEDALKSLGMGHIFQAEDGTVFRVSKPAGTFVAFRDIDYDRTRREGEKSGSMSLTDARAAGFEVK